MIEGVVWASRYALAASGVVIAIQHLWSWRVDRDRRPVEYQRAVFTYGICIAVIASVPLVDVLAPRTWAELYVVVAAVASMVLAVRSILYGLWIHLVARWKDDDRNQSNL